MSTPITPNTSASDDDQNFSSALEEVEGDPTCVLQLGTHDSESLDAVLVQRITSTKIDETDKAQQDLKQEQEQLTTSLKGSLDTVKSDSCLPSSSTQDESEPMLSDLETTKSKDACGSREEVRINSSSALERTSVLDKDRFSDASLERLLDENLAKSVVSMGKFVPKKDSKYLKKIVVAGLAQVLNGPIGLSQLSQLPGYSKKYNVRSCFIELTKTGWLDFLRRIKGILNRKQIIIPCRMMNIMNEYYPNSFHAR